jgi:hypothetical protein
MGAYRRAIDVWDAWAAARLVARDGTGGQLDADAEKSVVPAPDARAQGVLAHLRKRLVAPVVQAPYTPGVAQFEE